MDIPNRLPQPEKRSDKISKHDMRVLQKLHKEKTQAKKRAIVDEEIAQENRTSEQRARKSMSGAKVGKRKQQSVKIKMNTKSTAKRKHISPDVALLEQSRSVAGGEIPFPCLLSAPLFCADEGHLLPQGRDAPATNSAQHCKTFPEDEIKTMDPRACIWKDRDYGHILPNPHLWVTCFSCHQGIRTTELTDANCLVFPIRTYTRGYRDVFEAGPIRKWVVKCDACIFVK